MQNLSWLRTISAYNHTDLCIIYRPKSFFISTGYRLEYKSFIDRCIHCKCASLCQKILSIFLQGLTFLLKIEYEMKRLYIHFNVVKVVYVIIVCKLFMLRFFNAHWWMFNFRQVNGIVGIGLEKICSYPKPFTK